jgi:hypothetical protein
MALDEFALVCFAPLHTPYVKLTNGQPSSEGSTDVLSSYLRYAGGLTGPVVMKGYPECP